MASARRDHRLSSSPPAAAGHGVDVCSAADLSRGLARYFHRSGAVTLCEVPLPNGRRADLVALDARGRVTIVEIKVSRADLLGDGKWPDYLDWCDAFLWAIPPALDPALLDDPARQPDRCGLLVADRYDALLLRSPREVAMAPARRRAELLRIGRLAMRRMMVVVDPEMIAHAGDHDIGV